MCCLLSIVFIVHTELKMRLGLLRHIPGRSGRCSMYTMAPSDQPAIVIGVRQHETEQSFTLTSTGRFFNYTVVGLYGV